MLSVYNLRQFKQHKLGRGCNISAIYGRNNKSTNKYIKTLKRSKKSKATTSTPPPTSTISPEDRAFLHSIGLTVLV